MAGNVVSVGRRGCGADRLPFTRRQQQKNTPRELRAADKVTGIRLDQFLRGRLPGSPLAFAGQASSHPAIQPTRKPGSLRAVSELRAADKTLSRRAILVASRTFTGWMRPTERFKGAFASFLPTSLLPPSLACIGWTSAVCSMDVTQAASPRHQTDTGACEGKMKRLSRE